MRETLLTINHVWWLAGATIYVGVQTTLRLFLVPGWGAIRPDTVPDQFTAPITAATRFFVVFIPTWVFTGVVMIVTEWGDPLLWTAIVALAGLLAASAIFWFWIKPINRVIVAGVDDQATLTSLLLRWKRINDLRWAATLVMWGALCWYFVAKPDLPAALGR